MGNHTRADAARRRAAELPADQNWPDPLRDELAAMRTGKANWLRQAEAHDREGHRAEALALLLRRDREHVDAGARGIGADRRRLAIMGLTTN